MKLTGNILWTLAALLCGGWSGIALDRLQAPDTTAGPGTYAGYLLPALVPLLGNFVAAWLKRTFNIVLPLPGGQQVAPPDGITKPNPPPSPPRQSVAPTPARAAGAAVEGSTLTIVDPIGTVTITLTAAGNANHEEGLKIAGQLIEHYRGAV